tara:strand:- start:145 stop:438 length:294 start_codon:yes stop_codon:yes gene_type:complete
MELSPNENYSNASEEVKLKVGLIVRQTDYTEEEAFKYLTTMGYDEFAVVRKYLNIPDKQKNEVKSVNQEIYKQLRHKLESNTEECQEKLNKKATIIS